MWWLPLRWCTYLVVIWSCSRGSRPGSMSIETPWATEGGLTSLKRDCTFPFKPFFERHVIIQVAISLSLSHRPTFTFIIENTHALPTHSVIIIIIIVTIFTTTTASTLETERESARAHKSENNQRAKAWAARAHVCLLPCSNTPHIFACGRYADHLLAYCEEPMSVPFASAIQ